jgi:hypothetical protein
MGRFCSSPLRGALVWMRTPVTGGIHTHGRGQWVVLVGNGLRTSRRCCAAMRSGVKTLHRRRYPVEVP